MDAKQRMANISAHVAEMKKQGMLQKATTAEAIIALLVFEVTWLHNDLELLRADLLKGIL